MKIGIFSDVHSNLEAMNTVLEKYDELDFDIDMFVCLGDVVGYGASPNECCDIVKELARHTVIGNHDAAVCGKMDYTFYYDAARNALDWHSNQITEENREWLQSLGYREDWEDLAFCHGSPINLEEFEYVFNIHQAEQLLLHWGDLSFVTFIGHSHLTKSFRLHPDGVVELEGPVLEFEEGYKYIVTAGSVGQPRDNDNRACFGVYDHDELTFTFHRVEYDIRTSAKKIFSSDLSSDFAKRLFFGI